MENKKSTGNRFQIGIGMILFLIFMVLKLTNNIDWSWWWITSPLWIPVLLIVIALGIAALVVIVANHIR